MSHRSALRRLADRVGIVSSYKNMAGRTVATADETRAALLTAMGHDTSSEAAAREEIQRLAAERAELVIDPVAVLPAGSERLRQLEVRLPPDITATRPACHITVTLESGDEISSEGVPTHRRGRTIWLRIPRRLDAGYHTIDLRIAAPASDLAARQHRVVHPRSCVTVAGVLGSKRGYGIWTNLYTVRSARNLGVGDLTDLSDLVDWAAEQDAAFVGINPLHSLPNRGDHISPYTPTSRLFGNEIYIDVTVVPEFATCDAAREIIASTQHSGELGKLRAATHVDYDAVASLKLRTLRLLYDTLANREAPAAGERLQEFSAYKQHAGEDLDNYATYRALEEHLRRQGGPSNWRSWPQRFRRPDTPAVLEFHNANARAVDFHRYVQFELDRQLGIVASRARSAMAIGIYGDLALGSDPAGADAWAYPDRLVAGVHLGSPPDDFSVEGQDWGLSPLSPETLRSNRYDFWIKLLRANLRHSGALRLDHAMGLLRQFWIPAGSPGSMGAYVEFPARDLLGILALESDRQGAIIVGEDLGTVPHGFQSLLARWGILSSRVLYFERDRRKVFRAHHAYSKRAMVTANTHDQVPLAGYWEGRDLELRREASAFPDAATFERAHSNRDREQRALRRRLESAGVLTSEHTTGDTVVLTHAVHTFLARTPAPLIGLSLDDLAGETDPVNLPGISNAVFPSWSRKMRASLEELANDPRIAQQLDMVAAERRGSR